MAIDNDELNPGTLDFKTLAGMVDTKVSILYPKGENFYTRTGVIKGMEKTEGTEHLEIQIQKNDSKTKTLLLSPSKVNRISILNNQGINVNSSDTKVPVKLNIKFLSSIFRDSGGLNSFIKSNPNIVIVDKKNRFDDACQETEFYATEQSPAGLCKGYLADILMPDCIPEYKKAFKASFLSSTNTKIKPPAGSPWRIMILCGAQAVLRHAGITPSYCTIALLDRSERNYGDAEDHILQQYYNRSDDLDLPMSEIPKSVKYNAFKI